MKEVFSAPVNLIAVLVAAVAYMAVGMFWYSPWGLGKKWMKLMGLNESDTKGNKDAMMKSMLMSTVAALVMSYVLAHFIVFAGENTTVGGAKIALWVWVGFVATMGASDFIFAPKPKSWNLYFFNQGYILVSLLVMGAILGAWR